MAEGPVPGIARGSVVLGLGLSEIVDGLGGASVRRPGRSGASLAPDEAAVWPIGRGEVLHPERLRPGRSAHRQVPQQRLKIAGAF